MLRETQRALTLAHKLMHCIMRKKKKGNHSIEYVKLKTEERKSIKMLMITWGLYLAMRNSMSRFSDDIYRENYSFSMDIDRYNRFDREISHKNSLDILENIVSLNSLLTFLRRRSDEKISTKYDTSKHLYPVFVLS